MISDIKGSAGTFAHVFALVDGVHCSVREEAGELVVRPVAWDREHEVVSRGAGVPAELRAEYERQRAAARAFVADQLSGQVAEPISLLPDPHYLGRE